MINIIKDLDQDDVYYFRVVESTYVCTLDEETVVDSIIAEQLFLLGRMDYIQYRVYIQYYVCDIDNWTICNQENRDKCIEHYSKPDSINWDALIDDIQLKIYWINVVKGEQVCRANRVAEGLALISWTLSKPEAMDLFITVQDYIYQYQMADLPMLYWYTNSIVIADVIDFSTTGFAAKPYYSIEKRDLINSIISR